MSDEVHRVNNELQLTKPMKVTELWLTKARIVASSIGLFVRLTASFVAAACEGWLRKQKSLLRKVKDALAWSSSIPFPALPDAVTPCSSKLNTIRQSLSKPITDYHTKSKWFFRKSSRGARELEPEKSVHVDVLHDPSPRPIRADVVFIHGLHGSLFNTWKQGLWSHRKQVRNLPLKHKYEVGEDPDIETFTKNLSEVGQKGSERTGRGNVDQCDTEYDHLLENITDLLNNIDDKIKESRRGTAGEESEKEETYSPCWPRDWLPKDCPGVRVIAVNYTTDPFLWRPVWISKRIRSSLTQRSQQMEDILVELGVGQRPVVWVGHSKGGLFVKQMLVDARNSEDPRVFNLVRQTKGIMFYSVPHRGSSLAHWNLPLLRQSIELTEVKKDCQEVLELHQKFLKLFREKSLTAEVFSFVETVMTFMFVTNVRVVSVDSADLGLGSFQGVNIDHREICKPLNRECFLYKELINLIDRVV